MIDHIHIKGDINELNKCLEKLEFSISEDANGLTVYTESEPLFCFTRSTQDEIDQVVIETLTSYLETFYQLEGVRVSVTEEPIEEVTAIPERRLKPISRLRPTLVSQLDDGGRYALA
jgi:hypothetical protein